MHPNTAKRLSEAIAEACDDPQIAPATLTALQDARGGQHPTVRTHSHRYFLKLLPAADLRRLHNERLSLKTIAETNTVCIPHCHCVGKTDTHAFALFDYLELRAGGVAAQAALGQQLAAMHRHTDPNYGWPEDNAIGPTPQPNARSSCWITFWQEQRLDHQIGLAKSKRCPQSTLAKLRDVSSALPDVLSDHAPEPSLLHGDLWAGNHGFLADGQGVVFDPASYYGDRETDIAMTTLFGGFSSHFYRGYEQAWPLSPGHKKRRDLYQLYHVLNHFTLFGGHYAAEAHALSERILGKIR
ncbi:MAG TPA: hypothetical protein DD979_00805 [Gammaproteobacteria bacterium]|jgi:fructosamine-3-kinase|nr:hypothetical protein [Gammaproteobacteria bacterium]